MSNKKANKNIVEKAVVLAIVAVFIGSAFVPAVGSQVESILATQSSENEDINMGMDASIEKTVSISSDFKGSSNGVIKASDSSLWDRLVHMIHGLTCIFVNNPITNELCGLLTTGNTNFDTEQYSDAGSRINDMLANENHLCTLNPPIGQFRDKPEPLRLLYDNGLWWNSSWQYRRGIAIDHTMVTADLTNFPVLVEITLDHTKVKTDGGDIVFTADDGTTKFNHEIESYNDSTGYLVAWVNVTSLNSTEDTVFYVYYGNGAASNQENPEAVWDIDYKMVHHLEETAGDIYDSTSNNNDGSPAGGVTYDAQGKVDGAIEFDGVDDTIATSLYPDDTSKTLEVWIKFDSFPTGGQDMTTGCHDKSDHRLYLGYDEDAFFYGIGDAYQNTVDLAGVGEGEWVCLALTGDTANAKFYVNGGLENTASYSQSGASTVPFHIGSRTFGVNASNFIDGILDEVRISYVARSEHWINATYNNQNDVSSFLEFGEELQYSNAPAVYNPSPPNGSMGIDLNPTLSVTIIDFQEDLMNITFSTNASGSWTDVETFNNVGNERYNYTPSNMNQNGTTYYWGVNATDGINETHKSYMFTTKTSWWDNDWRNRKLITLDHTKLNSDVSDFPVLIDIIDTDLSSVAQVHAEDIVFVSHTGIQLSHEIESYDDGHLVAWVKIPVLSTDHDTGIYMYYGNPTCGSQEDPESVWDSNYVGVWHLGEKTGTMVYDSTGSNNDGTKKATSEPQPIETIINGGQDYDGSDDYIGVGSSVLLAGSKTINAWVKIPPVGTHPGGSSQDYIIYSKSGTSFFFYFNDGLEIKILGTGGEFIYPYALDDNTWHNLVFTRDGLVAKLYLDGVEVKSISDAGDSVSSGAEYIGGETGNIRGWLGGMDEFRISNIARNAEWIETYHNIIHNKAYIFTYEAEEICPDYTGKPFIKNPYPEDQATDIQVNPTLSIDAFDFEGDEMTIIFQTNATGPWNTLGTYTGGDDTYTQATSTMSETNHTYFWRACVIDPLGSNEWTNKTFSFTTVAGAPAISGVYPSDEDANYNPQFSVHVHDYQEDTLTVIFKTNATGPWETLGTYNGGNGVYTQDTSNMDVKNQMYYWSVNVYDGSVWVNETYSFTAQPFVLKWTYSTGAGTSIGPLAVDVDGDGIYEVFTTGDDKITCVNGSTGELIWSYSYGGISSHSPYEIHDLNNDGIPEVVISSGSRTLALHANDGSVYWNVVAESAEKHLVIADIEGDGYPYVYICSTDIYGDPPESGTGRLRKLRGTDGAILAEVFSWRPCWGGLSFADIDNDGEFELFMNDRSVYYHPPSLGKGILCYDPEDLTLMWYEDGITCSSHCSALVDVNDDGILDAVSFQQGGSGIWCLDGKTGAKIPGKWSNSLGLTGHSQFSIYDIDNDGNLEMITCSGAPAKVWDIGSWSLDATLDTFGEPPKMADVIGNGNLEIIGASGNVKIYNGSYDLIETISTSAIASTLVQDIDNDGQNELILISSGGTLKVYDTSAYAPTPRVRTNSLYYSERNMGAGVYVPPPGAPQPILKEEYPANGSGNVDLNPTLSIHAIDFRYDLMNITISTNASGVWGDVATFTDVGNDFYEYIPTDMDETSTTYYWRVTATDPYADNLTTTETYSFTTYTPPPFKPGWLYRKKLTIDHNKVADNLTDFPVLINITDTDIAAKAQPTGDDILFTRDNGETQLDHEIEYYDNATEYLVAWVKTNLSSTEDTILYMYYGNAAASNQENPEGVWDSHFLAVHHLEETSGTHYDSTGNDNDGTPYGSLNQDVTGQIDGADYFDGSDDRVMLSQVYSSETQFTMEAWIYAETGARYFVSQWNSNNGAFIQVGSGGTSIEWYIDGVSAGATSISLNTWYHVVGTFDGTTAKLYKNAGTPVSNAHAAPNWPSEGTYIGDRSAGGRMFKGIVDEVRFSDIARNASWITASYSNQNDPNTFMTIDLEETASEKPIISNESPENGATGVPVNLSELRFSLTDYQGDSMNYTVTTIPDIGSDDVTGVYDGTYTVPVSGLAMSTMYTWYVNATDGSGWTNETFTFTTGFGLDEWGFRKKITVNKQPEDNCRMYGVISDDLPDGLLQIDLIDETKSLKNLAASTNIDGWGIGYYPNYGDTATIERGAETAYTDTDYDNVIDQINTSEPKITLAHVRNCQNGCCCHGCETVDDPHPFVRTKDNKTWTFVHNGVVGVTRVKNLLGTDYLNENPLNCSGVCEDDQNCDSEVYFLLLLKHIENCSWHVTNGIVEAINELIDAGETGGLNFVLSDGNTMWAFRRHALSHHTLYYLYNETQGYSAVASDYPPSLQGDWVAMDDYDLVVLTSNEGPVIINVTDYNPIDQLTDFPVLIDIVDLDLAAKAQTDGDDILFTDLGLNKLDHEIEFYNSSSGHLVAWVCIPSLFMDQEKDIFMYYGNENAGAQENPEGVWDSHYMMVQHLEETSGTIVSDSTLYGNDGTPQSGVALDTIGKIDGADGFDGIDDNISIPSNSSLDAGWSEITMEAWVKSDADSQSQTIVLGKWRTNNPRSYELGFDSAGNSQLFAAVQVDGYLETAYGDVDPLVTGEWYHVVATYESGTLNLFVNGVLDATASNSGNIVASAGVPLRIGCRDNAAGSGQERFLEGDVDEVRVSDIARSSSWILMSYRNQNDSSGFIEVGDEEGPSDIVLSGEYPNNGATGVLLTPTLAITAHHASSYQMNITWMTNESGGWTEIGSNTSVYNGTYYCDNTSWADACSTKYWWKVEVNDGHGAWNNKTYSFTTLDDIIPPEISDVQASPGVQNAGGYVNITCTVNDNIDVDMVKVNITYPDSSTSNVTMNEGSYYYNATYTQVGIYNYFIWANDTSGNSNMSTGHSFSITDGTLLVDSEFNDSVDSSDLRANSTSQDWYESRNDDPTLLTLNTSDVGGNSGKKAGLKSYGISSNAYLTQEFGSAQTGTFNVSMDVYIDRIEDNGGYDRSGLIYVGDDSVSSNCPTGTSNERFVFLTFYDSSPGDTGDDLEIRARTLSGQAYGTTSQWIAVASDLSYDTWYTLRIECDVSGGTYDVYVDDVLEGDDISKYEGYVSSSVTHISFVADSDGRGDFFVDNVFAPAVSRYKLDINIIGNGSVNVDPSESTYAYGTVVELTATADPSWSFTGWSGDLGGSTNPDNITMDDDKSVTATFSSDIIPPEISNVQASPGVQNAGGYVNITCTVNDNIDVDMVKVNITYPDSSTSNVTMNEGSYYYNTTYTQVGIYNYFIWANDTSGNSNMSSVESFTVVPLFSWDANLNFTEPGGTNDNVIFGEDSNASDGQDVYDVPKAGSPPTPYLFAWFDAGLSGPYSKLWEDYRFYPDTYKVWNLSVKWAPVAASFTDVNITWNSTDLSACEYSSVLLCDVFADVYVNMLTDSYYSYNASADVTYDFQIICSMKTHITDLKEEWNIVSLPFNQTVDKEDIIVTYDGSDYNWTQATTNDNPTGGPILLSFVYDWDRTNQSYGFTDTLHPGFGYWMLSYYNCSLGVEGVSGVDDEYITDLSVDWNIVGLPDDESLSKEDIIVTYSGSDYNWTQATTNDNPTGGPILLSFVYDWDRTNQSYGFTDTLHPGFGYWMLAYYNCTLKREVV